MIEHLNLEDKYSEEPINFDLQVKKPLDKIFKKALVLGISDKVPKVNTLDRVNECNKGVPDAAFISNNLCMLIEVKIKDANLTMEQIKRHENMFLDGQTISKPIFRTWKDILTFFQQQKVVLKGEEYSITRFLIDQFINYCAINGVGPNKTRDFYINCFPASIRQLARDIDYYISNKYKTEIDETRHAKSGGISYTRKGRRGFFAKLESVSHILILSFEPTKGDIIQKHLEQLGIGKKRNVNATAWATPNREALIDLYTLESVDEIKKLIDEAFINRP